MASKPPRTSKIAAQLKAHDIEKPQLHFDNVPTNRETVPFKPLLLSKPHAVVPLETEPIATDKDSLSQYAAHLFIYFPFGLDHEHGLNLLKPPKPVKKVSDVDYRFPHPYQLEIEQYRYPSWIYTQTDPLPYHPFDSTTAILVDTEELLAEMLEELQQATEIAIDLEHHDQRSYIGIVSLMQISTRNRDWIVDTLKPWRRKLECLNEVFANPNIIKVLHGAYMDIVWLQRDLGLYIVGLFDTHYAARALGYAGGSLAFLLKKFANVDAQKQYQMADWRVRPLPPELFDYARSDTHYLLYIFDYMRNELIQRSNLSLPNHENDKIWDVLQKSNETALQRYEHPMYDAELGQGSMGWYKMLSRTPAIFNNEQFSVFRAVHKWRDEVGRAQDDSVHYVMPNHQVFSIARELPTTRAALLSIAQPRTQTVHLRADELVSVVVAAKERGEAGPEMMEVLNRVEPHTTNGAVKRAEPSHSVAAYVPKTAAPTSNGTVTASALSLRSATSSFWGSALNGSMLSQHRPVSTLSDVTLTVPLPPLTAEVFADPEEVTVRSSPATAAEEPEPMPAQDRNHDEEVFVLKELGKKRKRASDAITNAQFDGVTAQSDEVPILDEEDDRTREKHERRKARKEANRAAKLATAIDARAADEEDEPFDYNAAPSLLNPPRESREEARGRRKKEVNPYAKSLDAPKGLPRVQKERAGRSMTYK